jgi:CheY-like chemotaxis protein
MRPAKTGDPFMRQGRLRSPHQRSGPRLYCGRMERIVLAGRDWRFRALVRAQLIEEGFEVEAHETVESAVASLARTRTLPALIVADVYESERPSADLEALSAWAKLAPVWLLASRAPITEDASPSGGWERIFLRPLDLAEIVQAIQERTGKPRA